MPNFELSDEEKQLSETARDFARKEIIPVAGELDEHGTFPEEICKKGWETGLMNCELPEAYGGLGRVRKDLSDLRTKIDRAGPRP